MKKRPAMIWPTCLGPQGHFYNAASKTTNGKGHNDEGGGQT